MAKNQIISLIVPVYNLEKYVGVLIDSVLSQTYPYWELVIINDKSTDNSLRVIKTYHDRRIKVINNEFNMGLSGSRNKGIQVAKGDYIQFIDGDSFLISIALELEIKNLNQTNADLLHFNYNVIAEKRKLSDIERRLEHSCLPEGVYFENDKMNLLFLGEISHYAWSFVGKASMFSSIDSHFPNKRLFEDFATIYKWIYAANVLSVLDKKLYNYVQRDGSIMHSPEIKHAIDINQTVQELDVFSEKYVPQLKNNVIKYEMPRLLNAYGISLKSMYSGESLTKKLRQKILSKSKVIGSETLNNRDKLKIFLMRINVLKYGYKFKEFKNKFYGNRA